LDLGQVTLQKGKKGLQFKLPSNKRKDSALEKMTAVRDFQRRLFVLSIEEFI